MSGIDQRIVEMAFKGATFLSGVQTAINALKNLKNGLNSLKGSESDINSLDSAGKKFNLSGMSNGIDQVAHHFSLMRIAGLTVFTSLVRQGLFAGEALLKGLTIDPIKAGLDVYETKINAIQTILANTSAEGTNLKQVTTALNQLNTYANLTVYNFGQMAKNIGTFTAAGVDLQTSVSAIKGISNLAALSGSSADQASTAMYQLSQAIASGTVKLQDWNSVVNAGLGGKVFQNALIETARAHGVAIDAMIKKDHGFRNTLQQGWLTAGILTDTLKTFTGDLSLAQLKAMGFTEQESLAIQKQGKIALQSATQIRTISQLTQALKEEVATAWSKVFEAIIGNSTQAVSTLSAFHNVAESALTKPIYDMAKILQQFSDLGGRQVIIKSIENTFHALGAILHVVGAAFKEVFPSSGGGTSSALLSFAKAVERLTAALTPSAKTLGELKTIFVGLFSAVKIVIDVVAALFGGLTKVGGASKSASGGFLAFLATIAHFITNIRTALESGTALQTFFRTLGSIIAIPIKALGLIVGALGGFGSAIGKVTNVAKPFIQKVGEEFSKLAGAIGDGIKNGNFSALTGLINQLLLGGVLLSIKKFISNLSKGSGSGGGLFASIKESFESLTKTLKTMQDSLKAGILEKIAIAVALLAASLVILSLIKVENLVKALSAITIMFVELLGAMAIITKVGGSAGILKMEAIGLALNLLAAAIVVLAGAVAIFAQFSWEQLAKGLSAIAVLLIELVGATLLMSADAAGLITSAVSMQIIAGALNVLALAVSHLGKQSIGNLAKGIGSIAALLLILGLFNTFSGAGLISTAASMILVGAALNVIAIAVKTLGDLSVATLAKGLISVAAALLIIAGAMILMPPTMFATAVSLILVASALVILSQALSTMGGLSWESIAKSLVLLAASLVIIATAMALMTGALPGAAALLVVTASLAILVPVLALLGALSWESIAKGLVALAGVFVILAAAGILLTPLVPTLLGLGLAITLLGVGLLAAGAGVALFAVGLTALAVALAASGGAILVFVTSILSLIPATFKEIGLGIVAFATAIGTGGVAITAAFVAVFTAILNAIIKTVPLASRAFVLVMLAVMGAINQYSQPIITTFLNLILRVLNNFAAYSGRFVNAGINILVNLLNGIASRVSRVVAAGTNAVIAFINAVGAGSGRIVSAGINMVIGLVNGIANKIRASSPAMNAAGRNLASAIVGGIVSGIFGGIGSVTSAAASLASSALSAAKHALGIHSPSKEFEKVFLLTGEGAALGIDNSTGRVVDSVKNMGNTMLDTLGKTLSGLNDTISTNLDLQPKITPVLDLTQAKKGFNDLSGLSKDQLIAATASTASATSISAANATAAKAAGLISAGGSNLTFNQYNQSPTALSASDIYRRTRNQLSIAKGALTSNANVG